jgi:hypothetical protein
MIKKWQEFNIIKEESSPRLPVREEYWLKKGKIGKKVALYTHDDLDGLFCAIAAKSWLLNKGFEIVKYGMINYTDGWKYTSIDPKLINVVLDFASMPGDERDQHIDFYLDHHGSFSPEEMEKYKRSPVQKKQTASAYEALCQTLGIPQDELTVSVIDMVDAAKYSDYGVSWQRLLDFDLSEIKKSDKKRLEFTAAFNQFIKRGDTETLVSVIHNCNDASIYSIFNVMKAVYPHHNVIKSGFKKGQKKEFMADSLWRMGEMQARTRGKFSKEKKVYTSQSEFVSDWKKGIGISPDGYQIIGDLVFIPTGVWANALRARVIVEKDFIDGKIPVEPKFILLQYGSTLQVCAYKKISETENLPKLKSGEEVTDLGEYMKNLLTNFQKHLGYYDANTSIGQDEITVAGGHGGIGSVSNIISACKVPPYEGIRFIDMFKNKIINDLSGVPFNLKLVWSEPSEYSSTDPELDYKVIPTEKVTKMSPTGEIKK